MEWAVAELMSVHKHNTVGLGWNNAVFIMSGEILWVIPAYLSSVNCSKCWYSSFQKTRAVISSLDFLQGCKEMKMEVNSLKINNEEHSCAYTTADSVYCVEARS